MGNVAQYNITKLYITDLKRLMVSPENGLGIMEKAKFNNWLIGIESESGSITKIEKMCGEI